MNMESIKNGLQTMACPGRHENGGFGGGLVLLIAGLIGFSLGAFVYPTVQYGVEYGQAVAGTVKYLPGIPEGVVKTHIWSLPSQLIALGLLGGLSEDTLSVIVSGVHGMLSFQALGLLLFAMNGRVWLSAFAPLLFLYSRVTDFWSIYPVCLVGLYATPGALGLSYVVFLLAAVAAGWNRLGAVLLGMAPAMHGVLGAFMWLAVPAGWAWGGKKRAKEILGLSGWFFFGVFITVVSLCACRAYRMPLPAASPQEIKRLLVFFIDVWDGHRTPMDLLSCIFTYGVFLNFMGMAVCGVVLRKYGHDLPERLRFLLRVLLITGFFALVFMVMTHYYALRPLMPVFFLRAMPSRLLSVFEMIYPAILLGMLTRKDAKAGEQVYAAVTIILLFISCFFWWLFDTPVTFYFLILGGAVVIASFSLRNSGAGWTRSWPGTASKRIQMFIVLALAAVVLALAALSPARLQTMFRITEFRYPFSPIDIRKETSGPDVLLISSKMDNHMQYYFRRPVLLDVFQLDTLCYVPGCLPAAASILRDIYGIDFFNPPHESRHSGKLSPRGVEKNLWESRSLMEWKKIGRQYQANAVLAPADWKIALPVEWSMAGAAIYTIPNEE